MNVRDLAPEVKGKVIGVLVYRVCDTVKLQLGLELPRDESPCYGLVKRFERVVNGRRVLGRWMPTDRAWTTREAAYRTVMQRTQELLDSMGRMN